MSIEVPPLHVPPFVPVQIELDNFIGPFLEHLLPLTSRKWATDQEMTYRTFEEGITNKLVGVYPKNGSEDDMVLIRINGNNTDQFINRELETLTIVALHKAGIGQPLYCRFANGICYGYVPGRPITLDEMRDPELKVGKLVAKTLAKLHHAQINSTHFGTPPQSKLNEFFGWLERIPSKYDTAQKQLK